MFPPGPYHGAATAPVEFDPFTRHIESSTRLLARAVGDRWVAVAVNVCIHRGVAAWPFSIPVHTRPRRRPATAAVPAAGVSTELDRAVAAKVVPSVVSAADRCGNERNRVRAWLDRRGLIMTNNHVWRPPTTGVAAATPPGARPSAHRGCCRGRTAPSPWSHPIQRATCSGPAQGTSGLSPSRWIVERSSRGTAGGGGRIPAGLDSTSPRASSSALDRPVSHGCRSGINTEINAIPTDARSPGKLGRSAVNGMAACR